MSATDTARLLPWSSPDGNPCFLVGDGTGYVSRIADEMEEAQLDSAAGLIEEARHLLDARTWTPGELHLLAVELTSCLTDVHRVAKSRGARLTVSDDDGAEAEEDPGDHSIGDEGSGPRLPAEAFG
ncbi:hypothetical protein [Streptomyces angustmyceticus]|uniref:hypothetical protein n=1 Tax=Streptomyces angustmyceticus TaxID=285578 RepID=UPI0037FAA25B